MLGRPVSICFRLYAAAFIKSGRALVIDSCKQLELADSSSSLADLHQLAVNNPPASEYIWLAISQWSLTILRVEVKLGVDILI